MSDVWQVIIIDRTNGGYTEQNVTDYVDISQCNFPLSTWDKISEGRIFITIPIAGGPNLNIREMQEVWAGFKDGVGGSWTDPWYGGFVVGIKGTVNGGEHTLDLALQDYNILFDTTCLMGWPNFFDGNTYPEGYLPRHSVAEWLVSNSGGSPQIGLIPFHLEGIEFDAPGCVSTIFYSILIMEDSMPGNLEDVVPGAWGFISLRKVMEDMVSVTRYIAPLTHPAFFFVPVANGAGIIPSFRFIDLSLDTGAPVVATFNTAPDLPSGHFGIEMPFEHWRDAKSIRTEVVVKGVGGDVTDTGHPLNYAIFSVAAHKAAYPAVYQRAQRGVGKAWSGAPIQDSRLVTLDSCVKYAERVEILTWGPKGTITFQERDVRVLPGDYVRVIDSVEAMDNIYPVNMVDISFASPGSPIYKLTVGNRVYDLDDIIIGGTPDNPIIKGDAGNLPAPASGSVAGIAGGAVTTGVPTLRPVAVLPTNNNQNIILGGDNMVVPFRIQRQEMAVAPSGPLDPEASAPVPADLFQTFKVWYDKLNVRHETLLTWIDHNGVPHQQKLSYMFTDDTTLYQAIAEPITIRGAWMPSDPAQADIVYDLSVNSGGSVMPGATVSMGSLGAVLSTPFAMLPGDELQITPTGVSDHASLTLVTGKPLV